MKPEEIKSNCNFPKRALFKIPKNDINDYFDVKHRRIYPSNNDYLKNKIFEEAICIYLRNGFDNLIISNCRFKEGLSIKFAEEKAFDFKLLIINSNIAGNCSIDSSEAENEIDIDCSLIEKLLVTGTSRKIYFFKSIVENLTLEFLDCERFISELSEFYKYSLHRFTANQVKFDTDKLAISDYGKFSERIGQTKEETSEIYHNFVLKAATKVAISQEIKYQLAKATSSKVGFLFGYFYKPINVVLWMILLVFLYSLGYTFFFNKPFLDAFYFSVITFLTIGYSNTLNITPSYPLILMIFSEGLLGIVYAAALITTIVNSSRK